MEMFDAMKMSAEKRAALDVAESARESDWKFPSFVAQLFEGKFDWKLLHPYPAQSAEDKKIGDEFCAKVEKFLKENLDPDEVDRTGIIPDKVYEGFAQLGVDRLRHGPGLDAPIGQPENPPAGRFQIVQHRPACLDLVLDRFAEAVEYPRDHGHMLRPAQRDRGQSLGA